ncbi:Cyclic nucleotide-gated olfactory channel [Zootermopsis nevadensis]|uniref:Cyclic nucleotide-gated olfactory channel n=1 Tax=Zootermopsis nevadensis TaxID=136037 RepID=A0A067QRN1_ZOONE|nr:Cyclic nucleotide-gated olfactory channel [Zootermopsis nevadensis]
MKLRTTVQLSGAITTIQKKPPLKREDSFLKRFSTRQIPETQETMDTGDDGDGGPSSQSTASTRRRRRRKQRLPRTVVNPDENFYFYWLFLLSACVLYNLWTLIVRQSFPELQSGATILWFTCDGFSDAVFLLDVAVQFRTGYLEQGLMVYDSKKLAGHYIRSRAFLMDLCALLPLDLLQFYVGIQPILRFPRFLKVYRVYNYYYMVESRTVYPNLWRVVNLVHILLILAHWFGCFYYLLSEAQGFIGVWGYPYNEPGYQQLTRKYLGSLYWSTLTLTTIGDLPTPGTNVEYVFTIASYLIGVFIFATIVGQVGNVITNRNANRLEFERLLDGAKTYMRHHKVPGGMKRRVLRWYDYSWSRGRIQGGGDINTALGLLPDKLKTELALHVNLSVLKKVTIFQECQPEFLHDLVLKMKAYIFTPGDLICRKGEVAREMFIIADGILEVISETGRVLTTMKAGDFFGEIGILNLDGLNKRTADVRSVGYSELFSLSREDVLAAMKDYPEAQEILQSLGRKRLMDAREVSRTKSSGHHDRKASGSPAVKDGVAGTDVDGRAGKRIVEKLRSDVKGLKNVLRKSRHGARMKDESMELQPLNPGSVNARHASSAGHSGKGVLRRMSRVHSDDNYSREESLEDQSPTVSTAKLGEGLPLLQRLRLLKEKQDREEKGKPLLSPISPPPAPNTLSPPSFRLQPPEQEPQEQEVIGAGLPLIQRLLLLKQKEDHERLTMQATATVAADVLATTVKTQQEVDPKSMQSIVSPSENKLKEKTTENCSEEEKKSSFEYSIETASSVGITEKTVDQPPVRVMVPSVLSQAETSAASPQRRRPKPSLLRLQKDTKSYMSIDDLSPEYSGLPFVKKLKILNERQKLAELEQKVAHVLMRSSSLDSSNAVSCASGGSGDSAENSLDPMNLTRSHSEASAMQYVRSQQHKLPQDPSTEAAQSLTSPESNETLERRNLKSILKKLSASSLFSGSTEEDKESSSISEKSEISAMKGIPTDLPTAKSSNVNMQKLMRAPTIEGYAARHSKLIKSVTFNRDTLQSPPATATTPTKFPQEASGSLFPLLKPLTANEKNFFRPSLLLPSHASLEEEYFSEVIVGIKQVIQGHLEDVQNKFQSQFQSLELEVKRRDEIISQLQKRIHELEVCI